MSEYTIGKIKHLTETRPKVVVVGSGRTINPLTILRGENTNLAEDNKILRRLLWLRHGCSFSALYGDDGEMQCHSCGIDFKRADARAIEEAFEKISMEVLAAEQSAANDKTRVQ
jgi:hypothetical protein